MKKSLFIYVLSIDNYKQENLPIHFMLPKFMKYSNTLELAWVFASLKSIVGHFNSLELLGDFCSSKLLINYFGFLELIVWDSNSSKSVISCHGSLKLIIGDSIVYVMSTSTFVGFSYGVPIIPSFPLVFELPFLWELHPNIDRASTC